MSFKERILKRAISHLGGLRLKAVLDLLAEELERKEPLFYSAHFRPERAAQIGTQSDLLQQEPGFAIVMQGPLHKERDFTLETIRIYKKNFAGSTIILSTWEDEDAAVLRAAEEEGAALLLNAMPHFRGYHNINCQILSAYAGIQKAKKLGAVYVLKTRTDQRIYAPNCKEFLINMLHAFPVAQGFRQKKRLISTSFNTAKYRPYSLSDMLLCGDVDDMLLFWGCAHDSRELPGILSARTIREWLTYRVCEVYLVTEFLNAIGREPRWTLEDGWKVYADHFCIVDQESLDLYWPKYGRHLAQRALSYDRIRNNQELTFKEWFNLYSGLQNKAIPEEVLDQEIEWLECSWHLFAGGTKSAGWLTQARTKACEPNNRRDP